MTELIKNVIVGIIGTHSPCCAGTRDLLFSITRIGQKIIQHNRFPVVVNLHYKLGF
jgi:hypothetical protein